MPENKELSPEGWEEEFAKVMDRFATVTRDMLKLSAALGMIMSAIIGMVDRSNTDGIQPFFEMAVEKIAEMEKTDQMTITPISNQN